MAISAFNSETSFLPTGSVIRPANLTTSTTVVIPKGSNGILFTVEGTGGVRLAFSNQIPTANSGLLIPATASPIRLDVPSGIKLNFIEGTAASGATIAYTLISIRS